MRKNDASLAGAESARAVTTHDTNALSPDRPRALFVGTGGNLTLRMPGDTADVILKNVPSGTTLTIRPSHVRATGTTAADIVALY